MPINKQSIRRTKIKLHESIQDKTGAKTDTALRYILNEGIAAADTMVPVDTGNLLKSHHAPIIQNGTGTVGYTAAYAAAVHAKSGKLKGQDRPPHRNGSSRGKYWDPDGEPQFLEKGFDEIKPAIPAIIKKVYG